MSSGMVILLAVLGSSALGTIVAKYFRPNATPMEMLASVQRDRDSDRDELEQLKEDMRAMQQDFAEKLRMVMEDLRVVTDYAHKLREHIVEDKDPPPPEWPKGLHQ